MKENISKNGGHDNTVETVLAFREAAIANGYSLVRILTGKKYPSDDDWSLGQSADILLKVEHTHLSTGLLCAGLRVVDIDIDDRALSLSVLDLAIKLLDKPLLLRYRDNANRLAIIYRANEGAPKKRVVGGRKKGEPKVEVLGAGQQLVVDGVHESGALIMWKGDRSPATVPLSDLPAVTEEQVTAFLQACAELLGVEYAPANILQLPTRIGAISGNNALSAGLPSGWFENLSDDEKDACLREMLAAIAHIADAGREDWIKILMAAHTSGAPSAEEIARDWSAGSDKHSDREFDTQWNSFMDRPNRVTIGTIIKAAREAGLDTRGWWEAADAAKAASGANRGAGEGFDAGVGGGAQRQREQPQQPEPTEFVDPWDMGSAPSFPMNVLSPELRAFVEYRHQSMGATASGIAMMTLNAVIAAINQLSRIRMTQNTDWLAPIRMWALVIGDPSTLKSPTMDRVYGELKTINDECVEEAAKKLEQWKKDKAEAKAQKVAFTTPEPEPAVRLTINDTTAEKVAEILSRNPRGSNIYRHEVAGFVASMDRYNGSGGADQAFYLETFDGGSRMKDRVKGEIFIKNASLNIIGGIQPDKLEEIRDLQSDGMLARFIPIPMEKAGEQQDIAGGQVADDYKKMLRSAYALPETTFAFDLDAQQVCDGVRADLKAWEQVGVYGKGFSSWVGKLPTLYGSLCVALLVSDAIYGYLPSSTVVTATLGDGREHKVPVRPSIPNIITEDVAIRAERILREYVIPCGIHFYSHLLGGRAQDTTLALASFILTSDKDRFTPSDFTASVRAMRQMDTWEVFKQASLLVALGWLIEDGKGRTPSAWIVPKALRESMAHRREEEVTRKAKVRALIMDMAEQRRTERKNGGAGE